MTTGKPIGNMIINLDLNSSKLTRGLTGARNAVNYQMKAMKAQMQVMDASGNKLGVLQAKYTGLGNVLQANQKQIEILTDRYKKSYDENGKATSATIKYANQLNQATARQASYEAQIKQTIGAYAELQTKTTGITGVINKTSDVLQKAGNSAQNIGTSLTHGVTIPIAGAVTAVTTAAVKWESAFAGVKKTNDEIVDSNGNVVYSYSDLEKGLRDLAKELPASHEEIAGVAEAAGQLGIQTDNVVSFTKTMIDLGESTNMSAETAATSFARFANITQMSQKDFERLGAVVVDLGNNLATTESEITEMGLRLAGAGKQVGMSQAEIMSFAAALSSVGIEAEAGGTAFSKVMVQMQLAVEKGVGALEPLKQTVSRYGYSWEQFVHAITWGGKELTDLSKKIGISSKDLKEMYKNASESAGSLSSFADVTGRTSDEFAKLFKSNPSQAIIEFVKGLGEAEKHGTSAISILSDMDIKEVRLRDSLLRAANASGVFEGAIKRGTQAWEENTALTDEANKRYETTESKVKALKNEVVDMAIDMGGPFVDALRDALKASKPLLETLSTAAKAFSNTSPEVQKSIVKLIAWTAAAGPVLKIAGSGASKISTFGQAFVDLNAKLNKHSAMKAAEKGLNSLSTASINGSASLPKLAKNLGETAGKATVLGSAASSAAGSSGVGAMTAALGGLNPILLGIVGVGGTLALGYAAWKGFGEEAWNSSQRVKQWGVDVGKEVDGALDNVKVKTNEASGQFGLMVQGFNQNTGPMAKNFETIGATIESSLTKKVEGLDNLLKELPGTVTDSMKEIVENEKAMNQSALEKIQENNERIKEIREKASREHRDISVAEAQMISDLSKNTAEQYVNTLDISAEQRKAILNSMTGDISKASKEQAETWLKSLGEQRNASQKHAAQMRKEQEEWLKEWGYNLDGEFAQKYLAEWDKINEATTEGFDSQIAAIVQKYPELADKIHLATGELIENAVGANQYLIEDNQKLLDNAGYMADKLAENAKKNADTLKWVAKEGTDGAKEWNSLELLDKEGNVKTNAPEIIKEASKNITTWNNLKMVLHDANIDSNAKKMIGEAAIANDLWRGMAWEDKEAVLQDEFSVNVYKALESSGKWDELNFEQKKAVLYSNTPEVMAETLFNLGLWNDYQPEIKKLNAKNYDFLQTLSKSEEKLKIWNETPIDIKELFAKNTDFLNKIFSSEESLKRWNEIPNSEKELLANNIDFLTKILASKETLDKWNQLPNLQKRMLADNSDLLAKVFASEESWNAWKKLPDPVKSMLGDNIDILSKVRDGTISVGEYNKNVLPQLKKLLGDNTSLTSSVGDATKAVRYYNEKIIPVSKKLNAKTNALEVSSALDILNTSWDGLLKKSEKKVSIDFIGPMPNAKGTNFHPGGSALVNDQKGPIYEELIQLPTGQSFIPKGRNIVLDLPRGSKVLNATKTKRLIPKYADGVGNITAVSPVPNLDALILALNELVTALKAQMLNGQANSSDGALNKANIIESLLPEDIAEQYSSIGVDWLNNLMNGWNSAVPQFTASETLFISNYQNALKLQNTPNYVQGVTWNKNLMNGWSSLTGSFITITNSFCNQVMITLRNYNTPMYNNGRSWQQNNLNGWNSLYGVFIGRVNQLGNDSINNLRSKNGGFNAAGSFLMHSLINGINSMGSPLSSTMNSVANRMVGGIGKGVNGVISGVNYVLKEVESSKTIGNWSIPQYAKGTVGHPGGLAMINDQKGPVHEEYVQMPNGKGFIAKGRDLLVNLPKGTQVLNATLTKKLKKYINIPRYANGTNNFDLTDLLDNENAVLKFLDGKVDYSNLTNLWLDMTKSGVKVMAKASNKFLQTKLSEFFTHGNFDGAVNANGVYQYLVDIAQRVMAKFPGLTVTSGYRPGDRYYHGKRQAIDLAYPGVSGDSLYTAAANYAFEKFPAKIAYVITNGRVRDRSGMSGTGASGQWTAWPDGDHFDHIHLNGLLGAGNIFKGGSSTGVERWRSVAIKALKMTGQYNSANLNALLYQMQTESNGNPKAINNWDSNAAAGIPSKGLMQVIDPTFRSYALPPYNKDIYDPLSNILASIRYTLSRYGSLLNGWRGVGYENGGWIMKDGLFRGGEGNKPEVVVPLTKKTRAIELVGEVLAFLSGKSKQMMHSGQMDNHSEELLALIKQQKQQHNEMMAILKAILGKDFIIKSSDIGKSANSYMGADLAKLRYINGGI
ncbi:phage tail tape measure protein [Enterococcus hirae]